MPKLISRRKAIAGAAAAAAFPAIIGRAKPALAAERIVVGAWGGDFADGLAASIDVLMGAQGIEVVQEPNPTAPRNAKVFAERLLPRGTYDIVCVQPGAAQQMADAGLIEKIDATKVPNKAHILPWLQSDYMMPHIYSPNTLIYNSALLQTPPATFGDLLEPKYKGKFSVSSVNFMIVMMAAALYVSGDIHAMEQAKPFVQKLNGNGLKLYSSLDLMAPPLKSGELEICLVPFARMIMWQNAGLTLKATFPTEGVVPYIDGMVVPKNAPNKEAAYRYLNTMLDPAAQRKFSELDGYFATVNNAVLPPDLANRLVLPDPPPKIVPEDYEFTSKVQNEIGQWWQRTILG